MEKYLKVFFYLLFCASLSSCELLCQAGSGTCGMSSEQAKKLLHPKAYGEFWTKPGMTTESWRQDWMECGGKSNGNYSSESPIGADTAALLADSKRVGDRLGTCMQSKRYVYQNS